MDSAKFHRVQIPSIIPRWERTDLFWKGPKLFGEFFHIFGGIFFHFKLSVLLEAFSVKIVGSIARNDPFGSFFCEIVGSFAQNARFGSLFCEISRKHRAKRSFWNLLLWNFDEASHETIILEPPSVKFVGSFAGNARFGSFFCEIWRKPRTKRSFWKLFLYWSSTGVALCSSRVVME